MDTKALRRVQILTGVIRGRLSVEQAAVAMGLSPRHTRRLVRRFEAEGAVALVHGNRGRPPTNRIPEALKARILDLASEEYAAFNDVHLKEALARDHGIHIGRETLRCWLRAEGRRAKRKRRTRKHRSRRPRRACRGMMVQWDGSHHRWLGPGGPRWVLMAAVDDADGSLVGARFLGTESGAGYLLLLEQILEREGIPETIYQDRHGALCRNDGSWSLEEQLAGEQAPTQLGAILRELGVQPIFARSAQGKGRIERFFGVAQDRLVAELRRSQVETMEEANQFLEEYWIETYNSQFAQAPQESKTAYCRLSDAQRRHLLSFRYVRTVAKDNTVCLGDVEIAIAPGPGRRSYAKARVDVRQHTDGTWSVFYQDCLIATHPSTQLRMPERIRLQRRGSRRVRGAHETLQVYFTPGSQELVEETARSS